MKNYQRKLIVFIVSVIFSSVIISCGGQDVDTTAPAAVTELNAEAGEGKITLTWKDPSDTDLYAIKIYNGIETTARAVDLSDGILVDKGNQKYEVSGLEDGKTYSFKVSAVDAAWNESQIVTSNEVIFAEKIKEIEKIVEKEVEIEKTYACAVDFTSEDSGDDGVKISMSTDTEDAVIYYTTDGTVPTVEGKKYEDAIIFTEDTVVRAIAVKEGIENSPVSEAVVSIKTKNITTTEYVDKTYAKAVTFTSEDSGEDGVKVTMATITDGATIFYTIDGTLPTDKSKKYEGAVLFVDDVTVMAIAVKDGIENSPISEATISIKTKTITDLKSYATSVNFTTEDAGETGLKIVMSSATDGGVIYYTTDGTVPDSTSLEYTEPITINADTTIKAVTIKKGMEDSPVSVADITIKTKILEKFIYKTAIDTTDTYSVYHYQQNTDGGKAIENYSLKEIENNKNVVKGSLITDLMNNYTGFTGIAMAQNETAIYIFYDRNIITYTFYTGTECCYSDGTTEKKITGLYGANYTKPEEPSSSNYNFKRWMNNETCAPDEFGDEDLIFTAVWKDKKVDYSKCVVGDIILKNGEIVSYNDFDSVIQKAAAVIVRAPTEEKPALGIGIYQTHLVWCTENAIGYDKNIGSLTNITDSSEGWSSLQLQCSDATKSNVETLYPAWGYSLSYGETNELEENISDDWYLPTMSELNTIYSNKTTVNESILKAGGNILNSYCWSCNQYDPGSEYARVQGFECGDTYQFVKAKNGTVRSVRIFN